MVFEGNRRCRRSDDLETSTGFWTLKQRPTLMKWCFWIFFSCSCCIFLIIGDIAKENSTQKWVGLLCANSPTHKLKYLQLTVSEKKSMQTHMNVHFGLPRSKCSCFNGLLVENTQPLNADWKWQHQVFKQKLGKCVFSILHQQRGSISKKDLKWKEPVPTGQLKTLLKQLEMRSTVCQCQTQNL